jgi:hypothetical protein
MTRRGARNRREMILHEASASTRPMLGDSSQRQTTFGMLSCRGGYHGSNHQCAIDWLPRVAISELWTTIKTVFRDGCHEKQEEMVCLGCGSVLTHKSLIAGHSEIWESPIMLFVRDLIAINHFAGARGPSAVDAETNAHPLLDEQASDGRNGFEA